MIIPSREKASDTAKKVLFELKKLYGEGSGAVDVDDVMRALPSGGGKVVRKREVRAATEERQPARNRKTASSWKKAPAKPLGQDY